MSPIALGMDLLLALLLLAALGVGLRLEKRLKQLREGQRDFAGAVADLDRAAQRAERGLGDLRAATDEAVDLLAGRIEKARELASRLETMTSDAARPIARAPQPQSTPAPRAATSPRIVRTSVRDLPPERAEAAAEDLVLRLAEKMPERFIEPERLVQPERRADPAPKRVAEHEPERWADPLFDDVPERIPEPVPERATARPEPRASERSLANVDDDLFDAWPRAAGAGR